MENEKVSVEHLSKLNLSFQKRISHCPTVYLPSK